jgi:serine phosphatase RsbU (regulator of sigma subunit)
MNQLEVSCRSTSRHAPGDENGRYAGLGPDPSGALPRIYGEVAEDLGTLVGQAIALAGLGGTPAAVTAEILEFARPVGRLAAPDADPDRLEAAAHLLGVLAEREAAVQNLAAHAAQLWREIRFFLSAELVSAPVASADAGPALLQLVLETLQAHRGSIFVAEPPRLRPVAAQGFDVKHVSSIAIEDPESISAWVFRHGAPLLVNDPRRRPRRLKARGLALPPEFHDGFLSLPLLLPDSERTPVGVLNVAGRAGGQFSSEDVKVATAMAQVAALSLHRARITGQALASARLREELRLAAEMHAGLMPAEPPAWPGFDIAAATQPASGGVAGGDFYDFVAGKSALNVVVADVQGHGLGAALCASGVRSALRTALGLGLEPGAALAALNRTLAQGNGENGFFASAAIVQIAGDTLRYAAAGHPPLLIAGKRQAVALAASGPPAGAVPEADYATEERALAPGEVIAVYTDGLLDPNAGVPASVEELGQALTRAAGGGAAAIVESLLSGAPAVADDRTLVIVKHSPAQTEPRGGSR